MSQPVESRTATFLMTDIEGSTRPWEEQRSAMEVALAAHDALLRAVVEGAGGSVFKTTGDGRLAAFEQPEGRRGRPWPASVLSPSRPGLRQRPCASGWPSMPVPPRPGTVTSSARPCHPEPPLRIGLAAHPAGDAAADLRDVGDGPGVAAEALREAAGDPMTDFERVEYDAEIARLRVRLDAESLGDAWAAGRAMSMPDAVAFAVSQ